MKTTSRISNTLPGSKTSRVLGEFEIVGMINLCKEKKNHGMKSILYLGGLHSKSIIAHLKVD